MKQAKVLVVEDEPLTALEISQVLEKMGHAVPRVVDSADGVIGAALELHPDLVIMDIHLRSYTDGIDAAKRLSLIHPVPIIYLTAHTEEAVRERASRTSPAAFLEKPLDHRLFRETVTGILESASPRSAGVAL